LSVYFPVHQIFKKSNEALYLTTNIYYIILLKYNSMLLQGPRPASV